MTRDWSWDASLFEGAAAYYERGRLPYAPGLGDAFAASLGLDGRGRLLDIGCGPGTVALRVAASFEEVVGLDPDPGMLAEAVQLAAQRGIENARWVELRAEALPAGLGRFRVVTFAQSLHWLDQPGVFATVRSMLAAGGAVVHVDREKRATAEALSFPAPPVDAISELRIAYLGADRRAGQGVRNASPDGEDDVFRSSGFAGPEVVQVPDGRILERSVDDLVAEVFSQSGTAPHLFGTRLREFEADLRSLLLRVSPSGRFAVRLNAGTLKIWRPGSA